MLAKNFPNMPKCQNAKNCIRTCYNAHNCKSMWDSVACTILTSSLASKIRLALLNC